MVCGCWPLAAQASAPQVWVASPWQQVLRDTAPGGGTSVAIAAARNEYEPFRLVVTAGDQPLSDVTVAVSDLTGPGVIAAANVTLYREHYLDIETPSYRSTAPPGRYPDPLIPFVDPDTGRDIVGALYDASPFSVAGGENQGVWADVYVPWEAPPGDYTGLATVTAGAETLAEVPISLTVHGFPLPATVALRSWFGNWALADRLGLDPASPEFAHLQDRDIDLLLAHRCMPSNLGAIWPAWSAEGGVDDTYTRARLRAMVEDRHVNSLTAPFWHGDCLDTCLAQLHDLEAYLRGKGYLDLAFVYLRDEPNTEADYNLVRQDAALVQAAAPGIKRLVTEQTITQDPSWGDLYGSVDIWVPLWGLYDEPTAAARQALGEKVWSYTALCQGDAGNPFWEIDFPPLVYRAPFWTSWHYGLEGFLYWETGYWPADPWNAPLYAPDPSYPFWGEGILLYPGTEVGIDGFAPSIRLKLIREGIEDFEYMALASAQGNGEQVDAIVDSLATSFTNWSRDPEAYLQAREQLAALIRDFPFPDVPPYHWASRQTNACAAAGIVGGYDDGTYRPRVQVTRDQMAVYISRALAGGDDHVPTGPAEATFPDDVPLDHWAYRWIEYSVSQEVVQGYPDGTYRPDLVVDRGQMAVYIARSLVAPSGDAGIPDPPSAPTFPDVTPLSSWAWCYPHVEYIAAEGVTQGYPDGTYRPAQTVTRDQMAVYAQRAFELPK
jgi:hypothetical protein